MDDSTTLPQGADPLLKAINESKNNLADAIEQKRGRGRPALSESEKKARESARLRQKLGINPNTSADPIAAHRPAEIVSNEIMIGDIEPLSKEIVKAPFDLVSLKLNADLTPTDEESKISAFYLANLIKSYLPELQGKDPRLFNWVAFLISYALLGLKKLNAFKAKKIKSQTPIEPLPSESNPQTSQAPQTTTAPRPFEVEETMPIIDIPVVKEGPR